MILKWVFFLLLPLQVFCETPLADEFRTAGYREISCLDYDAEAFDSLYARFDLFIAFLQEHPVWVQKLYSAKERFIRSRDRNAYSSDFFGFYDESKREGRGQVAFYYSTHFHEFIHSRYPEINGISEIADFLDACFNMQQPCGNIFKEAALEQGLETFLPSILLKVIKYLPSYAITRPHYDGSAFSLFLDSTDNASLLLSPYKSSYAVEDFSSPYRQFPHSILLIPGALLTEFSIFPTPHIVAQSGKIRFAIVAFAMRPHYTAPKITLSPLPIFD